MELPSREVSVAEKNLLIAKTCNMDSHKCFDTDSNMQMYALEHFYKFKHCSYRINHECCWMWNCSDEYHIPIQVYMNDTKLSIFEALYLYSVYLNELL